MPTHFLCPCKHYCLCACMPDRTLAYTRTLHLRCVAHHCHLASTLGVINNLCTNPHVPQASRVLTAIDEMPPPRRWAVRSLVVAGTVAVFAVYYNTVYVLPKYEYNKVWRHCTLFGCGQLDTSGAAIVRIFSSSGSLRCRELLLNMHTTTQMATAWPRFMC